MSEVKLKMARGNEVRVDAVTTELVEAKNARERAVKHGGTLAYADETLASRSALEHARKNEYDQYLEGILFVDPRFRRPENVPQTAGQYKINPDGTFEKVEDLGALAKLRWYEKVDIHKDTIGIIKKANENPKKEVQPIALFAAAPRYWGGVSEMTLAANAYRDNYNTKTAYLALRYREMHIDGLDRVTNAKKREDILEAAGIAANRLAEGSTRYTVAEAYLQPVGGGYDKLVIIVDLVVEPTTQVYLRNPLEGAGFSPFPEVNKPYRAEAMLPGQRAFVSKKTFKEF